MKDEKVAKAAEALNKSEFKTKIDTKKLKGNDLQEAFMKEIEKIVDADDETLVDKIPELCGDTYNALVEELEGPEADKEEKEDKKKADKKKTEDKKKADKKPETKKGTDKKSDKKPEKKAETKKPEKKAEKKADKKPEKKSTAKKDNTKKKTSPGIGDFCRDLIKNSKMSNDEIAKKAVAKFGGKTTASCVAWYRNKLNKK